MILWWYLTCRLVSRVGFVVGYSLLGLFWWVCGGWVLLVVITRGWWLVGTCVCYCVCLWVVVYVVRLEFFCVGRCIVGDCCFVLPRFDCWFYVLGFVF